MKLLRFISELVSVVNNVYMYQILITFLHTGFSSSGSGSQGQCSDGQCVLGAYCNGTVT